MSSVPRPAPGDADLGSILRCQREAFGADLSPPESVRADRLQRLAALIETHAEPFGAAISADFGARSPYEILITETLLLQAGIRHALGHLRQWMKPQRVSTAVAYRTGRAFVMSQPLGVVGIISPWNYPLLLSLSPLVGVLAAGNRAMLKPSELTPRFSAALHEAVEECFPREEIAVVPGDVIVGRAFAALAFDHLVFTGSTAVGREVAQAAAANLTPVTLELGGKSPAIIDASCDLERLVNRLAWGKLINAGQTCIAPDYVLVPRKHLDRFVAAITASMRRLYPTFAGNPDYTTIINERHRQRLADLIEDARAGGATVIELEGSATLRLPPTLLLNVRDDMRVMQEEIFGPILPILPYDRLDDAIAYVNRHERPLALYWFGTDSRARDRVLSQTISGGVCVNDTLMHLAQDGLPFGGVGASGHGHYHGEFGFRQFSKQKPVFIQSRWSGGALIRPPYRPSLRRVLRWLARLI